MSSNPNFTNLQAVLMYLYPTVNLSRIVVAQAGVRPERITFDAAAVTNWFNILDESHRQQKVQEVVAVALEDFPERKDELASAERAYLDSLEEKGIVPEKRPAVPSQKEPLSGKQLIPLMEILSERLGIGELQKLCVALDVDYDDLPGQGKENNVMELILQLNRRLRVYDLIDAGKTLGREDISWDDLLSRN